MAPIYHQADGSARKLLFVYPLDRDVQQRLREAQPPCFSEAEADAIGLDRPPEAVNSKSTGPTPEQKKG
jgi:hypothetical protein